MSKWQEFKRDALPSAAGVYVVSFRPGKVAYVGYSCNLKRRFGEHRGLPPWGIYSTVKTVRVRLMAPNENGLEREARLIRKLKPIFNRRGKH